MSCLGFLTAYVRQCNENLAEGLGSVTPSRMSLESPEVLHLPWKQCCGKFRSAYQSKMCSSAVAHEHWGFCFRGLCLKMLGDLLVHNRHVSFVNLPWSLESQARTLVLLPAPQLLVKLLWLNEVLLALNSQNSYFSSGNSRTMILVRGFVPLSL